MANKPNIRFKGFTDDWEQRKLGEMSNSYSGGTPKVGTSKYYGGKIPFIRSAEINSDTTELFLTEEGLKCSSARLVDTGDILYALYGATSGEVGRARIKGAINQAILVIKPQAGYDYEFLTQWLRKSKLNIIDRYLQGGQGNLSGTIVNELLVEFPNYEEQTKIGTYFSTLDHLITLHQRKCDETKKLKKYMLQKMFPKNGEKNPEIRFAGFTDDWEQRKFSDVVDIGSGMDYKHLGEGDIFVYGTGGYMLSVDKALSYDKDAIGIGRKGTIDKPYILRAPFWTVDTLFYCIPRDAYDLDFTNCLFQNVDWKKKDESTGVPSLSKVIVNNVETSSPSFEEQRKIGDYFKSLDHLITLHQRKCDKLKLIKKFMLQNMFPKKG